MSEGLSFADHVAKQREKAKSEELAQKLLGSRGRKSGAGSIPNSRNNSEKPGSLMSRVSGITKRSASAKPDINGKWKHDLHAVNNPEGAPKRKKLNRAVSTSQIDRTARNFDKFKQNPRNGNNQNGEGAAQQGGIFNNSAPQNTNVVRGFSIRGAAVTGPWTVIASNFAPGTTAADIEAAMAPIGPNMTSCKLVATKPTVMAEMVFDEKESADNIIATYNNKIADGRALYVYMKESSKSTNNVPTQPAAMTRAYDDMDIDSGTGASSSNAQGGRVSFRDSTGLNPPSGPRGRARFSRY